MFPQGWGNQKNMKVIYKTSKKQFQKSLKQHNDVWGQFLLQNGPWGSPRQVPEPPQAAPRQPKGVSRQPLWLPIVVPGLPLWAPDSPLILPRCLQELLWGPGNIALLHRHAVTLSLDDIITSSNYHTTTLSHCHIIISSYEHTSMLSQHHIIIL